MEGDDKVAEREAKEKEAQDAFDLALVQYQEAKDSLAAALTKMHRVGRYPSPPEGVRFRLPSERPGLCHGFKLGYGETQIKHWIQVGRYTDDKLGEVFLHADKEGSLVSGLMDSFATLFSISLQYGVPLDRLITKFRHVRFEPSGMTTNKRIRSACSMIDYVMQWLDLKFQQDPVEETDGRSDDEPTDPGDPD